MPNENNLTQFNESAFLSNQVYRKDLEDIDLAHTRLTLDGQQTKWEIVKIFQRPSYFEDNGYFGIAFKNTETGKIIIANRGTESTSLKDWADNISLGLDQIPFQGRTSVDFTQLVANELNINPSQIYQTGHSKGAGFAILNAAVYGSDADAFDAPGYMHLLDNIASEYQLQINIDDLSGRVNTIYSSQDVVSKIGDNRIGNLYEVGLENSPLSLILGMSSFALTGDIPLSILVGKAFYSVQEHSMDAMLVKIQNGFYNPADSGLFNAKIEFSFENDVKEYFKLYQGNQLTDLQSSNLFPQSSQTTILITLPPLSTTLPTKLILQLKIL